MTASHSHHPTKLIACIQSRLGSYRLKRKALRKIRGKTMIQIIRERLEACHDIDEIVLTTADTAENDVLAAHAEEINLPYFRGSEYDLISRYLGTLQKFGAHAFIRITADCPLCDPLVIDQLVKIYRAQPDHYDLISNIISRTYPIGLDAEIIPGKTLQILDREITDPVYREIFPTYIMQHPDTFRLRNLAYAVNLSKLRWTVDYIEDLAFVRKIYSYLGTSGQVFTMNDILNLLKGKSEIQKINLNRTEI